MQKKSWGITDGQYIRVDSGNKQTPSLIIDQTNKSLLLFT